MSLGESPPSPSSVAGSSASATLFNTYNFPHFENLTDVLGNSLAHYRNISDNSRLEKYTITEVGQTVLDMVSKWVENEAFYHQKGIRYYRGALLHSKPGTGKSALIHEIGKRLNLPILVVDLAGFTNQEFISTMMDYQHVKAIMLFEDIDCIWNGRENMSAQNVMEDRLTFDCFLNYLSGIDGVANKYVFMTTNHLEVLDDALIREGRIDDIIALPVIGRAEKTRIATIICEGTPEEIEKIVEDGIDDSTAAFENRCTRIALNKLWNKPSIS